ncbi:hypothetical protein IGI04_003687 [Brassica rapa subsp. trilocularis]|uniref:Uncharacterized protein n=1 Tax=Brassica rapa subsp. trilocularis TaxID=1813537 RepID=A0ABQ7NZ61_BRACM|nr:hypothetical protein IGI04_003687 [Brassica rapa subsp. trilocularis]
MLSISREKYRQTRLQQYKNTMNMSLSSEKKEVLNVHGHVAPSEVGIYQNAKFSLEVTKLSRLVHLETSREFSGRIYADPTCIFESKW